MTKLKKIMVKKPIRLNGDKTQRIKSLQHSKTKILTKLKNFNCNKTKKLELGSNSTKSLTN